jgi:hypothetical protein
MPNTAVNPNLNGYTFDDFRNDIWGDSFNWDFTRTLSQVVKLVIHHTVTDPTGKTPRQQAEFVAQLHKARGWAGIGYHFIVANDGTVLYVGDIGTGRANVMGNNEKVIGISLIGDFTKTLPTAHQILATNRLCNYFMTQYPALVNINTWDDVWGHKDCVAWAGSEPTTCPSPAWRDAGDSLYNRIKTANYMGYPDWENAKGVTVPTPPPVVVPPPVPTPPPIISDPMAIVDCGKYGHLEVRKIIELLTVNEETVISLRQQLYDKTVLLEKAQRIVYEKGWPWQKVKGLKILFGLT